MPNRLSPLKVVQSGLCIGCGSCAAQQVGAASVDFDNYGQLQPHGHWTREQSERLTRTCPFSPWARDEDDLASLFFPTAPKHPTVGRFLSAYVGYACESGFRERGSSGGMVSWVLDELFRRDLVDGVAHVVATADPQQSGRLFKYRISRTREQIWEGAKSRYYPVELSEILNEITETPGRYAIVGVPCFIKAIQLLRLENPILRERIRYTLGLFCGHMKSSGLAESFASQMGVPMGEVKSLEYRIKDSSRPASTYTAEITLHDGSVRRRDWWNLVDGDWGSGFFQYSACNFCDDVIAETADISFGDAWVEPYSSDGNGTNVVVVRTPELQEIITEATAADRLHLEPVDEEFIVATQAAGFRQRREGLAYRLTWPKRGLKPHKRVVPQRSESRKRRLMYRCRAHISKWSHRVFWLCKKLKKPQMFLRWARLVTSIYHGLVYSRGRLGKLMTRLSQARERAN